MSLRRAVALHLGVGLSILVLAALTAGSGAADAGTPAPLVDSGSENIPILISDFPTNRLIRMTDLAGSNWEVGPTAAGLSFNGPWHVSLDSRGRIYVADRFSKRIIRMDDVAGNGWKALDVSTGNPGVEPHSVAVEPASGRIYIARGSQIARIDDMDGNGWTTFGPTPSGPGSFDNVKVVILDPQGRLYVSDTDRYRIDRFDDMQGTGWITFGSLGSGVGQFNRPEGLAIDALGRIYITDNENHRIVRINDMTGAGWVTFGSYGSGIGQLIEPHDIGVSDSKIYIADTGNQRIVRIDDMTGAGWTTFGTNGPGTFQFQAPKGIRLAPVMVSAADVTVAEGQAATFTVALSGRSSLTVSVHFTTADGSATAGSDYTATSGTLAFAPGTTVQTVTVTTASDLASEPNETFTLNLSGATNAIIADGQGVGTIIDDDPPPSMAISDVTVTDRQPGSYAYFTVSLSPAASGFPITVNYATADGTALAGNDYIATNGTLTIPPGTPKATIAVPIVPDTRGEGGEIFFVNLSSATYATIVDGQGQATIVDGVKPLSCASRLDPQADGTSVPADLVVSEVAPGSFVEAYNATSSGIALSTVTHTMASPAGSVALSTLAPSVVVPASGYAKLSWPPAFTDVTSAAGETALFADGSFLADKMMDFVCWGSALPNTRKPMAEGAGKWSGACASALSAGAIQRLRGTDGKTAASYDTVSAPSPMSCVAIFTVTKTADTNDGVCDSDCSLREAILAANAAPGPDMISLPAGTYTLSLTGAGEEGGATGDLDVADDLDVVGVSALKAIVDGNGSDRILDIAASVTVNLHGLTLRNGSTPDSGGGIRSAGNLTVTDSVISNNTALAGGGIALEASGQLSLRNLTLSGNVANTDGAGIETSCTSCTVTLADVTVSANKAKGSGGGIFTSSGATVTLSNATLTRNTADDDADGLGKGGGMSGSGGTVTIRNTILAGNTDKSSAAPDCDNSSGILASQGYNLLGNNTGCAFTAAAGDQIGPGAAPLDPKLGPLTDNRGPTPTHALLSGSPALDLANPTAYEPKDQRSYLRPFDGNGDSVSRSDIGSFEACSPVFADVTAGSAFEPFISQLFCRGVTSGCAASPLSFCPTSPVTRAQMAVFVVRSIGEQPSGALHGAYFGDVADNGFAPFINRMLELGITSGCGTRVYCPGNSVTRAQMAVFLVRAMEEKPSTVAYNAYFSDIVNDGFAAFINRLYELQVTGGCGTNPLRYCPTSSVTRSQMAVFLIRSFFSY